ncbi:hypothetical protein BD410DRAFT_841870 [Rickenella mellea]|uniref:DNA-directed RNA polymerase III subunit RPC9 n=1 Tax=Rickenella mellea TaxID=50990 RepID=A0A4Y7PXT3_9AGAM|nr:hypothetical protein BD410DRAFT_841870 [Rickenella mellea]
MEVISARSALLSNFEVLTLLRELESDQLARTKTALRIKKEEEQSGEPIRNYQQPEEGVSENLRTVEFEAIQYLTADYQPLHGQNEASIQKLVKDLEPYELTKAEKLQIVNLAPTETVELYVIVEELEDRLGDKTVEVLDIVRKSLLERAPAPPPQVVDLLTDNMAPSFASAPTVSDPGYGQDVQATEWAGNVVYDEFVDTGEGAGVEGDLEMEDD